VKLREVEEQLAALGFTFTHWRGSHRIYSTPAGVRTSVVLRHGRPTFHPDYVAYAMKRARQRLMLHKTE
jgi:predicted RNA binding protein YcfA (HicA-like mRNA interferase family)